MGLMKELTDLSNIYKNMYSEGKAESPEAEEEKRRYDLHENSPDDAHYRRFLSRLLEPLEETWGQCPHARQSPTA